MYLGPAFLFAAFASLFYVPGFLDQPLGMLTPRQLVSQLLYFRVCADCAGGAGAFDRVRPGMAMAARISPHHELAAGAHAVNPRHPFAASAA